MNVAPDDGDDALIVRICRHDEDALHLLLRKYYARLCDFAFSVLRRRDLAEEAVSNVFLNVWRRRETLVIKTNARSYLFGAVSNQSLNLMASQIRTDTVPLHDVPAHKLVDERSADSDILYEEFRSEIDSLLFKMPAQRQLVFRMNRLENLRYKEIALALSISERTVQNHMVQAIRQITAELPRLRNLLSGSSDAG